MVDTTPNNQEEVKTVEETTTKVVETTPVEPSSEEKLVEEPVQVKVEESEEKITEDEPKNEVSEQEPIVEEVKVEPIPTALQDKDPKENDENNGESATNEENNEKIMDDDEEAAATESVKNQDESALPNSPKKSKSTNIIKTLKRKFNFTKDSEGKKCKEEVSPVQEEENEVAAPTEENTEKPEEDTNENLNLSGGSVEVNGEKQDTEV